MVQVTIVLWILAIIESYYLGKPIWDQLKVMVGKEWIHIQGTIGVFLFCAIAFTIFDLMLLIAVILFFIVERL
jgi:hypothetical protein